MQYGHHARATWAMRWRHTATVALHLLCQAARVRCAALNCTFISSRSSGVEVGGICRAGDVSRGAGEVGHTRWCGAGAVGLVRWGRWVCEKICFTIVLPGLKKIESFTLYYCCVPVLR